MPTPHKPDAVDVIRQQWAQERPDLDTFQMGLLGRMGRCAALIHKRLNEVFALHGLTSWEFDVLATLRRSGPPHSLAPTALFSSLMLSSGTMTRQLQLLAERGLVERIPNPDDGRSMLVRLTPSGLALIDQAVTAHVANMGNILAPLGGAATETLDASLRTLLLALEVADEASADE